MLSMRHRLTKKLFILFICYYLDAKSSQTVNQSLWLDSHLTGKPTPPSSDPPHRSSASHLLHRQTLLITYTTTPSSSTKPENVFVGEDGCLKIGDFGLSRTEVTAGLSSDDDSSSNSASATATATAAVNPDPLEAAIVPRRRNPPQSECHTTGVGTASYASPEQLQGRRYGVRSDLFSLGLVLLELCCCFTTTHERADAFQAMRQPGGSAPPHLAKRSPAVARLAELLCRTVPKERPSAEEMLEMLDDMDGRCGCEGCPGGITGGADRRGGRSGSGDVSGGGSGHPDDSGLREELAAKTRKVEEQVRNPPLARLFLLCPSLAPAHLGLRAEEGSMF